MNLVTVVIETPRHSRGKYVYDKKNKRFCLKKLLPLGMSFPYDFGMVEDTKGEDGDPVDAMVITEFDTYPGIEMKCRVIGALLADQRSSGKKAVRNDRFFFIPEESFIYDHITDIKDFSSEHNRQLAEFFINYNKAENKEFVPLELLNMVAAKKLLGKELH
ncbi:MAG TPA: inorganic diphosphatase [Chitinophagaceae bacterium]|nr:inorganic diphosphatase [Chitinophagaceae bacterium]